MSAQLPIIKSESENTFYSRPDEQTERLGMAWYEEKKRQDGLVRRYTSRAISWALYSAWKVNEPRKKGHEGCA